MVDIGLAGFTALVIDDNDFIRLTLKKDLGALGFTDVYEAINGMEALTQLERKPDIIICDINMEPLNGFEFVKHVRALNPPASKVPIIFLTGDAHKDSVHEAISLSIDGYLLKPVTQEKLKSKLTALLSAKK